MSLQLEENEFFTIPVYTILYKEPLLLGIPINIAALIIGGIAMGFLVFNSLAITLFFLIVYLMILIVVKFSKKFDYKMLDILVRKSFKKYISY